MNVIRKQAFQAAAVALTSFTVLACGTESAPSITADLAAPATREAKITLNAALDVSVFDQALLDRFVIEDIQLNVADVRLLGADPRIPAGGLVLLTCQYPGATAVGANRLVEVLVQASAAGGSTVTAMTRSSLNDPVPENNSASAVVGTVAQQIPAAGWAALLALMALVMGVGLIRLRD